MSRIDSQKGLIPTIFDRLIDVDSAGNKRRRGYNLEQMLSAVRRDLEALLNTRPPATEIPEDFIEARKSVLNYGLPDLAPMPAAMPAEREEIGRLIERVILQFEPRLRDVRASLVRGGEDETQNVRFKIVARLNVDPSPEVNFSTVLELETGHASIKTGET